MAFLWRRKRRTNDQLKHIEIYIWKAISSESRRKNWSFSTYFRAKLNFSRKLKHSKENKKLNP